MSMEVEQKEFEIWCREYSKRWKGNWENYCLVKDAWLAGFYTAREKGFDAISTLNLTDMAVPGKEENYAFRDSAEALWKLGDHKVKVVIENHQLFQGTGTKPDAE